MTHADPPTIPPGRIESDRPCVQCSYNLIGQTIVREPHYGLLITRCPECGAVASVQDFPLLGTWARRLGHAFAAIIICLMIIALPATSGVLYGLGSILVEVRADRVARDLQTAHLDSNEFLGTIPWHERRPAFARWYLALTPSQRNAIVRPWRVPQPDELGVLALVTVASAGLGLIWAAFLSGRRPVARLIWWLLITALSALFVTARILIERPGADPTTDGRFQSEWSVSRMITVPTMLPTVTIVALVIVLIMILLGDRSIHWLIRLMLPPRMQRLFHRAPFGPPV